MVGRRAHHTLLLILSIILSGLHVIHVSFGDSFVVHIYHHIFLQTNKHVNYAIILSSSHTTSACLRIEKKRWSNRSSGNFGRESAVRTVSDVFTTVCVVG
jgi:hypothetical protein